MYSMSSSQGGVQAVLCVWVYHVCMYICTHVRSMCGLVDEFYVKKGKAFHGWNRLHREVTT